VRGRETRTLSNRSGLKLCTKSSDCLPPHFEGQLAPPIGAFGWVSVLRSSGRATLSLMVITRNYEIKLLTHLSGLPCLVELTLAAYIVNDIRPPEPLQWRSKLVLAFNRPVFSTFTLRSGHRPFLKYRQNCPFRLQRTLPRCQASSRLLKKPALFKTSL
jgi:hypothetical protein